MSALTSPSMRLKFQFPPPRRGRPRLGDHQGGCEVFQFPPPRRGRPSGSNATLEQPGFNSRPRAGGVPPHHRLDDGGQVSIPAPAQGASSGSRSCGTVTVSFNSRPRAGGVAVARAQSEARGGFNSRPRAGGVPMCPWTLRGSCGFNSRPRAGGVTRYNPFLCAYHSFNSRPRAGGV